MSNSVSTKTLNILKAALPFVPVSIQRNLSYFVKIEEFNNMFNHISDSIDTTLSACELNDSESSSNFNMQDFMYAIRPYLDKKEFDTITNFINFFHAYNIYQSLTSISGNNSSLQGLLQTLGGNSLNHNSTDYTSYHPDSVNLTNQNHSFHPEDHQHTNSKNSNNFSNIHHMNNNMNDNKNSNTNHNINGNTMFNNLSELAKIIQTMNSAGTNNPTHPDTQFSQKVSFNQSTPLKEQNDTLAKSSIEALNSLLTPNKNQNDLQNENKPEED
ncbi:MAG: hypothetical protein II919_03415 [Lachnospiraceae bacterium]|nr:hypothetical protein [Lachnospiraceae bacterium]